MPKRQNLNAVSGYNGIGFNLDVFLLSSFCLSLSKIEIKVNLAFWVACPATQEKPVSVIMHTNVPPSAARVIAALYDSVTTSRCYRDETNDSHKRFHILEFDARGREGAGEG